MPAAEIVAETAAVERPTATPAETPVAGRTCGRSRGRGRDRGRWQSLRRLPSRVSRRRPQPAPKKPDIETALGTRWAVWVGGLALALGGLFLIRYSIEAGIFGPACG